MITTPMKFISNIDVNQAELLAEAKRMIDSSYYDCDGMHFQWNDQCFAKYPLTGKLVQLVKDIERDCWDKLTVVVTVRYITAEHHSEWKKDQAAHFDGPVNLDFRSYIIASAPTTIQYLGEISSHRSMTGVIGNGEKYYHDHEEQLTVSSILPMKMYRMDRKTLHSIPWGAFVSPKPRFFFRCTVYEGVPT